MRFDDEMKIGEIFRHLRQLGTRRPKLFPVGHGHEGFGHLRIGGENGYHSLPLRKRISERLTGVRKVIGGIGTQSDLTVLREGTDKV